MKPRLAGLLFLTLALVAVTVSAQTEFYDAFDDNYSRMGTDLTRKPYAEVAEITDFVYEKDVATFTFTGTIYLLRYLDDRPTTAVFLGEGTARINVPSHTERESMLYAIGRSDVEETFDAALMNFSDDIDLRLREKYTFEKTRMSWSEFGQVSNNEFHFHPVVYHEYDHYFELIRSHMERAADGYFWINFGRYTFSFDPNRPEEVIVGYEHEGGDVEITEAARMQRQEKNRYGDYQMSEIAYPTAVADRTGTIRLKGLDGKTIERAHISVTLDILADSLRFVSLFLNHNLKVDSVKSPIGEVHLSRRNDFSFMGLILPEYVRRGDQLVLEVFYHGNDFHTALPFVENPKASPHNLTFEVPRGYDLFAAALMEGEPTEDGHDVFLAQPAEPYHNYVWQPAASGYDTITEVSDIGLTLSLIKNRHITKNNYSHFIPPETYEPVVKDAFNYMTGRLGPPPGTFDVSIFPDSGCNKSMPGLMCVPQVLEMIDGTGGLEMSAGNAAARQWFGNLMQPKTDREYWLLDSPADYLSLVYITQSVSPSVFFGELLLRRDALYTVVENDNDLPLAAGRRVPQVIRTFKGGWLLHMLRYMMYDLKTHSERTFYRFLNELRILTTTQQFSNADIKALAEKYYGQPLDWFFKHWVFERNYPEYKVEYTVEQRDDGYYVKADVATQKVYEDFQMPVVVRVEDVDGNSTYHHPMITGLKDSFELGPLPAEPKEFVFNEFASVLCKADVDKK